MKRKLINKNKHGFCRITNLWFPFFIFPVFHIFDKIFNGKRNITSKNIQKYPNNMITRTTKKSAMCETCDCVKSFQIRSFLWSVFSRIWALFTQCALFTFPFILNNAYQHLQVQKKMTEGSESQIWLLWFLWFLFFVRLALGLAELMFLSVLQLIHTFLDINFGKNIEKWYSDSDI